MSKRFKDAEKHSKGSSVRHKETVRELALDSEAAPASPCIEQEIAEFEKWADANGYRKDGYVREWMLKAWLARAQQGKP